MRHGLTLLAIISLSLSAFACGGTEGTQAAEVCAQVTCPTGTAAVMTAAASSACSGGVSGERGLTSVGLSASAACMGEGECAIACEPVSECCGGESWTDGSYTCETPCSAACSCAGKCGTVTGPGCSAECGSCSGNQSCLNNECVDSCPDDVTTCGAGVCCDSGTAVCVAGECCDPVKNCTGRACGDDGCGGDCEALGDGWGCNQNEVCENYQCVQNNDCGGSLPVCELGPDGEPTGQIRNCGGDGKWADGPDCALNELGKTVCVMTSAGAVCAECGDDDDCSDGGICVVKPGGAECAECTEDVDCQNSEVGQACKNGKCGCSGADDCAAGQECVGGVCEGTACDPSLVCDPEDGPKRYCGADGCGGLCGDKDWTCNGTGVCTADGQCEPKENFYCKFQPRGDQPPVEIPWGMPFCNSMIPNLDTKAPPYDPNLPGEAVVSCNWNPPTEDAPDDYGCVCSLHVEEAQPEGLNCSAQGYLCRSKLEGWDNLNAENTLEDFECLEPTTCTEFMAEQGVADYVEYTRVCNTGYTDKYPEGWIVYCEDDNGLPRFRCSDCQEEGDGDHSSQCDDPGIQCFPKDQNGDGVIDDAACEESKADWCPEDGGAGPHWNPGCCSLVQSPDDGSISYNCTGGVLYPGDDNAGLPGDGSDFEPWNQPDPPENYYQFRQACHYDEATNEVSFVAEDCGESDQVCQTQEVGVDPTLIGTCVTPVELCPNGKNYDTWCNVPGDDFIAEYPEGSILTCMVNPYIHERTITSDSCENYAPPGNWTLPDEPEGMCNGEDPPNNVRICVEKADLATCERDYSQCCAVHEGHCVDGQPQVCTYDAATNTIEYPLGDACQEDETCVDWVYSIPGDFESPVTLIAPTCQFKETCPDGSDNQSWCNPEADDLLHNPDYAVGALMHCEVQQPANIKTITSEDCTDNYESPSSQACGFDPFTGEVIELVGDQMGGVCAYQQNEEGEWTHASCQQDLSVCCDVLTPTCTGDEGNQPTVCEYDAETNVYTFVPQDPCSEGTTCVDRKWSFNDGFTWGEMLLNDGNEDASQSPQPATCEVTLSCPFGAEYGAGGHSDQWCNPPQGEPNHEPDYAPGAKLECVYYPETNQRRVRGESCQQLIENEALGSPGTTISSHNTMCGVQMKGQDCCIVQDYLCKESTDGLGGQLASCGFDYGHCCDEGEHTPSCKEGGPTTCELIDGPSYPPAYEPGVACSESSGQSCVDTKISNMAEVLEGADIQTMGVAATCETPVACEANDAGTFKACNHGDHPGFHEAWGERIIECLESEETNEIYWRPDQSPPCAASQECFSGGLHECSWCKGGYVEDIKGTDSTFASGDIVETEVLEPRCDVRQICPASWCHPSNQLVNCEHNADTNYMHFSTTPCGDTEACVVNGVFDGQLVEYHDSADDDEEATWYNSYVENQAPGGSMVDIWLYPEATIWTSRCIDTSCGPEYLDDSESVRPSCGDPTQFQCHEPDGPEEWDEVYLDALNGSDDPWIPDFGCTPKTHAGFPESALITTYHDALSGLTPPEPDLDGDTSQTLWNGVFWCSKAPAPVVEGGDDYFTRIGTLLGEADMTNPPFVMWGWQAEPDTLPPTLTKLHVEGEVFTEYSADYIFPNNTNGMTKWCDRCMGSGDTKNMQHMQCCLLGHGIMAPLPGDDPMMVEEMCQNL